MRYRRTLTRDEGFSLVEVAVGMGVSTIIVVFLGAALASGLNAALTSKAVQKATAVADRAIESARSKPFAELGMDATHASYTSTDCAVDTSDEYTGTDETVVAGGSQPCVQTEAVEETTFTVERYVTWATNTALGGDADAHATQKLKRFTVVITWETGDRAYDHSASTLVADADKGFTASESELSPTEQTVPFSPGSTWADFAHTLSPPSVPEVYDLTIQLPDGWPPATFYEDRGTNGVLDDQDVPLGDTNSNGIPDTGQISSGAFDFIVRVQPQGTDDRTLLLRATRTSDLLVLDARDQVDFVS